MKLETKTIESDIKRSFVGQIFSFILGVLCIIVGAGLFMFGKNGYAIAALITAIAPIFIAFISGSLLRKAERKKKNDMIE